ncbi:MAG: AAA family ATPase [Thiothrix sp.]|nr:AAA family ATPase [Thiothrix sp.]MDD5395254.1 AAA family ATPase [Thiothrix sp.]
MIRFPYGISDFHRIRTENHLYLDRTAHIAELEEAGQQLIFLRPRRFGKSLLLSTLANYYDVNTAPEFEVLFGDLAVGRQPTPERNRYLILRWDFSKVSSQGNIGQIKQSLFHHINRVAEGFYSRYAAVVAPGTVFENDALATFEALLNAVTGSGHQVYLLIDEYDNFANEVLVHDVRDTNRYHDLLEGEGILKTLFKVIKGSASEGKIARVFITGVSPLVLSDVTSGYNVATNVYFDPRFNQLCGVTQAEVTDLMTQVLCGCGQDAAQLPILLDTIKQFYNGYRFCGKADKALLYNPTLCFYFLRHYQRECTTPRQMLDANLAMDAGRIRYIATLPAGAAVIEQILDEQNPVSLDYLEDRFGVEKLHDLQTDPRYMVSLLYFFGVLTITAIGELGELELGVPNRVIHSLYLEELRREMLPNPQDQQAVAALAKRFYQTAELQPLADYLETTCFAAFSNRDYAWSNELTIKTAFMTLLFNDIYYLMDSEAAVQRRYTDLLMIVRSGMRQHQTLKDFVLEFKYLSLGDVGMSGGQVRQQSREALAQLPVVQVALQAAQAQLRAYRQVLDAKYQEPQRLYCIAVVALGFERLVWQTV